VGSGALWLGAGLPLELVALGWTLPIFGAAAVLLEFGRAARGRAHVTGGAGPLAWVRLLGQNRRRYGGLIVHLGVVLIAAGVTTSTFGKVEREATLNRGETLDIGPYRLTLTGLRAVDQPTHLLVEAEVAVAEKGRPAGVLRPGQRFYPSANSPFASIDVRYGLRRDLYVVLGSFDREGRWAAVKAQIHPMIAWIWVGGAVTVLGGVVAIWPGGRRRTAAATVPEAAAVAGAAER
jgi:cytochrome c-type biogenesis protein CcmF